MKISLSKVYVNDQEKALRFYTSVLGFTKAQDVTNSGYRWLTVTSPQQPGGPQLLLESSADVDAAAYQKSLYKKGVPAMMFDVEDIEAEHKRLRELGAQFKMPPTDIGPRMIATLDDTVGNIIQLNQEV